jgi:hypothetical protein
LHASLINIHPALIVIFTSFLITVPFLALANAGSPIIWFNVFHLLFMNAIIGYIESQILLSYKLPNKPWIIITANYVSMMIGFYLIIPSLIKTQYGQDLWMGEGVFGAFVLSFLVTLVLEYPFFVFALKEKKQIRALFKPFLVANIVTNVAMTSLYYLFIAS